MLKKIKRSWVQWSENDIAFLKKHANEMTARELKRYITSHSIGSIRYKRRELGLGVAVNTHIKNLKNGVYKKHIQTKKYGPVLKGRSIDMIVYLGYMRVLNKQVPRVKKQPLQYILEDVCNIFEVPIIEVLGDRQFRRLVICRQIFCYIAKRMHPHINNTDIANFINYAEHSMVTKAFHVVKDGIKLHDPKFIDYWHTFLANSKIYKTEKT